MNKKYFWRRGFAYIIDLLIVGFFATIIVVILNRSFDTKILAPELFQAKSCGVRTDLVPLERMNELLPLEDGQVHKQVLCRRSNMLTTSFYTVSLQKIWKNGNTNYNVHVSFYSDEHGNQVSYISSEPFLYLIFPFVIALFINRTGRTPGKYIFRVIVYNDDLEKPDLKSALKREYFKGIIFVGAAIFGLYTMFGVLNFEIDDAAKYAQLVSDQVEQSSWWVWVALAFAVSAAIFWFQFGSFIRWRGRTYWDQFAGLNVCLTNEFVQKQSDKE